MTKMFHILPEEWMKKKKKKKNKDRTEKEKGEDSLISLRIVKMLCIVVFFLQ